MTWLWFGEDGRGERGEKVIGGKVRGRFKIKSSVGGNLVLQSFCLASK